MRGGREILRQRPVLEVEGVEPEEQVGDEEQGQGSRPGVEQHAVGVWVHEVRHTTIDQPLFDLDDPLVAADGVGRSAPVRVVDDHAGERIRPR